MSDSYMAPRINIRNINSKIKYNNIRINLLMFMYSEYGRYGPSAGKYTEEVLLDITKYIISKGIDINYEDKYQWNILAYAISSGFLQIKKYLVEVCGMDMNKKIIGPCTKKIMYIHTLEK